MINYIRAWLFQFLRPEIEAHTTMRILNFSDALIARGQIQPIKPGTVLGNGVVYDEQLYAHFKPRPHIVVTNPTPNSTEDR